MSLHAVVKPGNNALPWIVWLHGFLGSGSDWCEVERAVENPQLFIDLPGHGGSQRVTACGFAQTNRLLCSTLLSYNILNYWLVGYSLGGRVAMYHASRKPAGLCGLVVEGGHPGLLTRNERRDRRHADAGWVQRLRQEPLNAVLNDWYRQPVFASLCDARRATFVTRRLENNPEMLAGMLRATSLGRQLNLRPWLASLSVPFHFLCGEKDPRFQGLALSTHAQIHTIPDAGHNAHRENPQAFGACLHAILQSPVEDNL